MNRRSKTRLPKKAEEIGKIRLMSIYYTKFMLIVKLAMIAIIALFLFTPFMQETKIATKKYLHHLSANSGLATKKIIITGHKNSDIKQLIDAADIKKNESIFMVDLNLVQNKLQAIGWIDQVIVSRVLPQSIFIHVREHEPYAIWQKNRSLFLVNKEGDKITSIADKSKIDKKFKNLLHVVGSGANVQAQILEKYFLPFPILRKKLKAAIRRGNRRWDLVFNSGILVKMPEKDFSKALSYLHKLDKKEKLNCKDIKILDLRDYKKFYIQKTNKK